MENQPDTKIETKMEPEGKGPYPGWRKNLKTTAGPGRPKGSKDKKTILTEALMKAKIAEVPLKIRKDYLAAIAHQELTLLMQVAKKEETKLNAIREGFDRTEGKPPVSMAIDSHSTSLSGSIGDLMGLLEQVHALQLPGKPTDPGVVEVTDCQDVKLIDK